MAVHTRETMVGLFVAIGLLVGIGGVVWLGASEILKGGHMYVSYFDHSVGSIAGGSPVKYMGLEVGSVRRISVSPEPTLMQVVMKIRRPDLVTDKTVCEIQSVGFTGVGFVELTQKKDAAEAHELAPSLDFKAPYPIIPSQQAAGFGSLIADAKKIAGQIESLNLQQIVDGLDATVQSANKLVSSPSLEQTMDNLAAASGKLDDITTRVDRMVASDSFAEIPGEAHEILTNAQRLLSDARAQVESLQLAQTSQEVEQAVGNVDDRSQVIAAQVESLLQNLQQASDNLNRLLERLDQNPSELIFGKPAPRRRER